MNFPGKLGRGIRVRCWVEEQDGELRSAARCKIERIFARKKDDAVRDGNVGLSVAEEFVKVGEIRAGGGHSGELRKGRMIWKSIWKLCVRESLFTGYIEAPANEQREGEDCRDCQR